MAHATPTTSWLHRHRPFLLRPLLLVLTIIRPASSQFNFPPPAGATFAYTLTPPSPPPPADGGGLGGGSFNVTTSLPFVGLVVALFLIGFFSAYLRRCSAAATAAYRGGAGRDSVSANAAVAAAAAAAFTSAAGRSGRCAGLDAAAMEALPVLSYATARALKAGRGALECAVCLAEFDDGGEKLRLLPGCCHVFHAACIDVWLAAHVTCPVCRADLADPAVAAAGHVLAADLAAQAEASHHTVVNVETSRSTPREGCKSDQQAEERADRYTLRLPERLRREIEEAKRHRRAVSAVPAAASASSGRWASSVLRTMSAARPSRRWSGLFRALSGTHRDEQAGTSSRRVAPLQTHATGASNGEGADMEVVVVQDDAGAQTEKYYAHSLTFAGFLIDGDVAAGDWNPGVFQVSTAVPAGHDGVPAVKP